MKKPECTSCRHYQIHEDDQHRCGHERATIMGSIQSPSWYMRREGEACGPNGKLFQSKARAA